MNGCVANSGIGSRERNIVVVVAVAISAKVSCSISITEEFAMGVESEIDISVDKGGSCSTGREQILGGGIVLSPGA